MPIYNVKFERRIENKQETTVRNGKAPVIADSKSDAKKQFYSQIHDDDFSEELVDESAYAVTDVEPKW